MAVTNEILRAMVGGTPPATAYTDELLRLLANTSDLSLETNDLFRLLVGSTDKTLMTNPLLRLRTGPGFEQTMTNDLLLQIQAMGGFTGASGIPGAVADYDFVNDRYTGPALSVVRAGPAYVDDLAGTWTQVAPNTLRRSNKGLLVEGAQTNSIRNNSMQGAVPGTPGTLPTNWVSSGTSGLAPRVIGMGVESGIEYIDIQYVGTATGASINLLFDSATATSALTGQLWTLSSFVTLVAGTLANVTALRPSLIEGTAAGASVTSGFATAPFNSGSLSQNRVLYNRTLSGGATVGTLQPFLQIAVAAAPIDFTIRVGWPQLEQWNATVTSVGGASSPIRTTNAAVTRAADVVSATLAAPVNDWTIVSTAQAIPFVVISATLAELNDGTSSNTADLRYNSSGVNLIGVSFKAAAQSTGVPVTAAPASSTVFGVAYSQVGATGVAAISCNGAAAVTGTNSQSPTGLNKLQVGGNLVLGGRPWNSYIQRLSLLNRAATPAELATFSVPK